MCLKTSVYNLLLVNHQQIKNPMIMTRAVRNSLTFSLWWSVDAVLEQQAVFLQH